MDGSWIWNWNWNEEKKETIHLMSRYCLCCFVPQTSSYDDDDDNDHGDDDDDDKDNGVDDANDGDDDIDMCENLCQAKYIRCSVWTRLLIT